MNKLLRFIHWPLVKKTMLIRAFCLVIGIRLGLWVLPFKWVNDYLKSFEPRSAYKPADWQLIREVANIVRSCSRFVPQATCLTQAIAVRALLAQRGQYSNLQIGVEKDGGRLRAHAWVEVEGKIVIGRLRDIHRYSTMAHQEEQPA